MHSLDSRLVGFFTTSKLTKYWIAIDDHFHLSKKSFSPPSQLCAPNRKRYSPSLPNNTSRTSVAIMPPKRKRSAAVATTSAASDDHRPVWLLLVDTEGGPFNGVEMAFVSLPSTATISDFRRAVQRLYDYPNFLKDLLFASLRVRI